MEANTACYVEFSPGSYDVVRDMGNNGVEIGRIEENLKSIMDDDKYDLDSIVITASASPEGSFLSNDVLSWKRSVSVTDYFKTYLDSLKGFGVSVQGSGMEVVENNGPHIEFIPKNQAENWRMLDAFVREDETLTEAEKKDYFKLSSVSDPDIREMRMSKMSCYPYLRSEIYPRLRTVRFDFFLHRKGMVQDTIRTTVIDSSYMRGVQAIKDRDYKTALTLLKPYSDYNTAVAYCALDYNASALEILSPMPRTSQVRYLLAILLSRTGRIHEAVEEYRLACEENPSLVHRGNLDPEISSLIRNFNLNDI